MVYKSAPKRNSLCEANLSQPDSDIVATYCNLQLEKKIAGRKRNKKMKKKKNGGS